MKQSVLLDKNKHDRHRFDCGVEALNNYFRVMASQQAKKDNSRTYVLEDSDNPTHIMGFYTLAMIPVDLSALPDNLRKKHQSATSAGLIARLAVDRRYQSKNHGEWLLLDALNKLQQASDSVGFPLVVVDAKDGAEKFYQAYGFRKFQGSENKLFLTMADIRKSLGAC